MTGAGGGGSPAGRPAARPAVRLSVNGEGWGAPAGATVADVVAGWCPSPKGVAVARNGEVVPKSRWPGTEVSSGDRIEIVSAAAGG